MSTPVPAEGAGFDAATKARLIETNGIDIIDESERTAKPRDLFWPWFAANVSVFGMSYAAFVYGFGVSFGQAVAVTIVGVVVSFLLCGIIAIAGKRGSVPTMVLSRAAFGVQGQKLPGIVSWLLSIGWETFLSIMAVMATATVFSALGWASGTATKVIATLGIAALIVVASVLGYHTIMRLQSILTWITGAITLIYMALTIGHINWSVVAGIPNGDVGAVIGALTMVMTGFGLGWINIAADWSRYQRRDASNAKIVLWNTLGGSVAPVILVVYGLLLAGSDPALTEGITSDPIGTLAGILPIWVLIPFWLTAVLALVSGAVLGIYSSGLTLLSLGIKIPRPAAAAVDGVILTAGTIFVVFFAESFLGPFQSFLLILGVPMAAWAGILIADIASRKRPYDEAALFDARGRYGAVDWVSVATLVIATVIGWGLVVNQFASDAAWANWQGYLLEPLGLGTRSVVDGVEQWDGTWPWANLGVLLALVLGFVVTWFGRRGIIARQEGRA
ncbi:MAG TPA: cytosine permease [Propioniciclava sp.]|uniref:purine-cytosine permease family protein n=1 Tax=Propioniciclava sp. TaxID=2038686 RepID=UPI002C8A1147|nr:cytosine permease [Propioniciclava sp.]HRL47847.1 cytosine permease [Propioniciclava sp.]HRL78769.1 cytosine permease [Propioniciclava sp.]